MALLLTDLEGADTRPLVGLVRAGHSVLIVKKQYFKVSGYLGTDT